LNNPHSKARVRNASYYNAVPAFILTLDHSLWSSTGCIGCYETGITQRAGKRARHLSMCV